MIVRLIGSRELDFVSQNGEKVKGMQLFFAHKSDGVNGEMCDKIFLRDGFKLPALKAGSLLNIAFDNKGKPESVELAQQ